MTKVYLCGPINGCTDAECKDWREEVKKHLSGCVDPMKRDYRGREDQNYREIVELDKRDYRASDILLANCPSPSWGTAMEIHDAWTRGIPVVAWIPPGTRISPWLRYHATCIVHSLADAIAKISEIA